MVESHDLDCSKHLQDRGLLACVSLGMCDALQLFMANEISSRYRRLARCRRSHQYPAAKLRMASLIAEGLLL